ncbi:MAG: hypothetical protein ACOX6T_11940 [Myxococcales bacterium]|jgi:hypothetical protein
MPMSRTAHLSCAFALLLAAPARAGEAWTTVTEGPIVVKTRSVPGTDVREVWAEGEIDAPAIEVQAALMDTEGYARFMKYITESRWVGEPRPDGSRLAYALLELPIVSPRDYAISVKVDEMLEPGGTGRFRNHWFAVPDTVPRRTGVVRARVNSGGWTVTPRDGGRKAWGVYRFQIDPGGYVPGFAADLGNRKGVTGTFRSVEWEARRRAAERKAREQEQANLPRIAEVEKAEPPAEKR